MNLMNHEEIPAELSELRQWVPRVGDKFGGTGWNNPENWKELDEIRGDAIFVTTRTTNVLIVDADHILNKEDRIYIPLAYQILKELRDAGGKTYAEKSRSGKGYHILYNVSEYAEAFSPMCPAVIEFNDYPYLDDNGKQKIPKIEFYYQAAHGFFLTGRRLQNSPDRLAGGEQAAAVMRTVVGLVEKYSRKPAAKVRTKDNLKIDRTEWPLLEEALNYIPASCSYRDWIAVGISLFNVGMPFEVFDQWSVKCPEKYQDRGPYSTEEKWKSFRNTSAEYGAGTILHLAKLNGWKGGSKLFRAEDKVIAEQKKEVEIDIISLSEVEEREVEWLIPGWIPAKSVTLIGGDGGSGKTSLWCDIAAKVSAGKSTLMDQGYAGRDPCRVLFFSSEDSVDTVLKKKMRQAGGNMDNLFSLDLAHERFNSVIFENGGFLEDLIRKYRPALCVFDPVQQFIPPTVRMAERNAMRRCLAPLKRLAEVYEVTFLIICHSNKRQGASGRNRLADSADLWDFARSVIMLGETGEGKIRYMSQEKSSYTEMQHTILFKLTDKGVEYQGTTIKKDRDFVNEQMKKGYEPSPQRIDAENCIRDILRHNGRMTVSDLKNAILAADISETAFRRAKAGMLKAHILTQICESKGRGSGVKWYIDLNTEPGAERPLVLPKEFEVQKQELQSMVEEGFRV